MARHGQSSLRTIHKELMKVAECKRHPLRSKRQCTEVSIPALAEMNIVLTCPIDQVNLFSWTRAECVPFPSKYLDLLLNPPIAIWQLHNRHNPHLPHCPQIHARPTRPLQRRPHNPKNLYLPLPYLRLRLLGPSTRNRRKHSPRSTSGVGF